METQEVKDVPSNEVGVSVSAFAKAAIFMTILALAVFFTGWKIRIGPDFNHVIGYGMCVIIFARIFSWLFSIKKEADPICGVLTANIMLIVLAFSNLDVLLEHARPPFIDVLLVMLLIHMLFRNLQISKIAKSRAIPILVVQGLILCAGLYGLHFIF